jgi:hypothetical protein
VVPAFFSYNYCHWSRPANPVLLTIWADSGNVGRAKAWPQTCIKRNSYSCVKTVLGPGIFWLLACFFLSSGDLYFMKKRLFMLGIGFFLALAAMAQTSSQTQTPPVTSTTPATQIGSGAQTKAGTPAPTTTTSPSQVSPTAAGEPPAQATTPTAPATGGVAGAASSSAPSSPSAETSAGGAAANDPELEGQIQNALNKEPTLTGDSTHVTVSADTIELAGNVGTSKEKVTATRIVQSYAGNKKVMNHLTISGKGEPRTPQQENPDANHPAGAANPATNLEPNKGSQPPASQPPHS